MLKLAIASLCIFGKTWEYMSIVILIENCRLWLDMEISVMNPKVVLLFGDPAAKSVHLRTVSV